MCVHPLQLFFIHDYDFQGPTGVTTDAPSMMNQTGMNDTGDPGNPLTMACNVLSEPYAGMACESLLTSLQTCYSGGVTSPSTGLDVVPALIGQTMEQSETSATTLLRGLPLLMPTAECRDVIMPFICLANFPLCDAEDQVHTIVRKVCMELRDSVCMGEWQRAIGALGADALPICEQLPDITDECFGMLCFPGTVEESEKALADTTLQCSK